MAEYARLVVSVDSRQVRNASKDMAGMNRSASSLTGGLTRMIAPLVSVATAMAALNKAVTVQRQFDVLNAGLITATGNSEKAALAFQALQDFAAKTPYSLDQAVEGFTKLVNLGLTPSEKALMSYGNTASAMGKDLSQMIEAVADASTGEFERLKEFGIKAKAQGNQLSLTFQGTTTTIGNNAAEIERYLTSLGENEFAGAMAQRMETLDGALSNLGDSWDTTFRLINEAGLGDVMEESVRGVITALDELNASLASGELEGYLGAISGKFDGFGRDVDTTFGILSELIADSTGRWGPLLQNNVDNMIATFRDFPENVRAFIQIMTVEVLAGFDRVTAYARAFNDGINAIFTNDTWEGVGARLEQELSVIDSAREGSLTGIMAERDAALASFDSQIEAAGELRKTYDDLQKARAGQGGDRLEQFGVAGGEGDGGSGSAAAAKKLSDAYASLVSGLERQKALYGQTGEAARISYELTKGSLKGVVGEQADYLVDLARELDAKRDLTEQEKLRIDILRESGQLRAANDAQFELEYAEKIAEYERQGNVEALQRLETLRRIREVQMNADQAPGTVEGVSQAPDSGGVDAVVGGPAGELIKLQEQAVALDEWRATELEKQRGFLEAKAITEEEYANRIRNIHEQHQQEVSEIEQARYQVSLAGAADLFGNLADITAQFAGEQSGLYKTMFIAQKAFAIAQSMIAIQQGIALAAANPWPLNLGAMASVAAATAGLVSNIASVGMSFDGGGYTGNGPRSGGLDGKGGFLAMMHPQETVIDHTKSSGKSGSGGGAGVVVNLIEDASKAGQVEQSSNDNGEQVLRVWVARIRAGGTAESQAIEQAFGLQRAGR